MIWKIRKLSTTIFCSKMKTQRMLLVNLFFVLTMILLLSSSVKARENVRCRENERQALLEFKAGLDDDYEMLSSWGNDEEECCEWKGIRCSNLTGHVTILNLPSSDNSWLSGKISPSISKLKQLKHLNLGSNILSGEIPPQLGNLTNLISLDLGSCMNVLAADNLNWLSHLQLLTHLDLSCANLSRCNDWVNQIYKLSSLTHLDLGGCGLPEYDPLLPLNTSSILKSLAVVDLQGNNFVSPRGYNWLFNFTTTLVSLDLSWSSLPRIPQGLGRIISLESLFLSRNQLQGMLPDSFRNLTRLTTLDLTNNNINTSLSDFFYPFATKEKNSLQVLELDGNQLSGSFPDFFANFSSLQKLSIRDSMLSGQFPDNFWQLSSSLVHLNLYGNQLTGPLPNLTLFSSLETLDMYNNKLEGTVPEAYLSNLSKLSYLDLSSNSLSFNFSSDWIPPFRLDKILFRNCTLGPRFPNWIKSQHNTSVLDISNAGISDTIPLWLWDLSPRLTWLDMSNNQIKGILPNISLAFLEIEGINLSYNLLEGPIPHLPVRMASLDLSHNMFTGPISFICTSISMDFVDLSYNKLSGQLSPDCLMNNWGIYALNLANNDFSGSIPTSIGKNSIGGFQSLILRNNSFTGHIPLSLMNMDLRLLDLSENKLNGEVPTWIGTHLTRLVVLSLRMNEYSGSIPPQICQLNNARVLDLSQNKLTGSIPHCINNLTSLVEKDDSDGLGSLTLISEISPLYPNTVVQWKRATSEYEKTLGYLKLIDFSGNRLVGGIPEQFASLKELMSLNLSRNQLTGNIIPMIGQMKNLEILDLSRNHLLGEIPSSLARLTLLSVLDLSNNNLTGKIPSSTQLQSFSPADYAGNEHLCGPPLSKCGRADSLPTGHADKNEDIEEDDDKFPKFWLYVSAVLGFSTGFWGLIGPIMVRRTWRQSYYKLLGDITNWICVTTALRMTRLQRKFYG